MQQTLGKPVWQVKSAEEFMHAKVRHALTQLTDEKYTADIAEIMSKIILLSEDNKIKDPEILKYLK